MIVLFGKNGTPIAPHSVIGSINTFGFSYNKTVKDIINRSQNVMTRRVFFENVGQLMPNFKMTRSGPFKGVEYLPNGTVSDPNGQIAACWRQIGNDALRLKNYLLQQGIGNYFRSLVDISSPSRSIIVSDLWNMFKKLIPVCMGDATFGLVAASKVLFAIFPEAALPVDNVQWKKLFKTIDYGDIVSLMADEIIAWEGQTGQHLDSCDPASQLTLPAIYNVMAMKARP